MISPEEVEKVLKGGRIGEDTFLAILRMSMENLMEILAASSRVRRHFFGNSVRLCAICNAKSGRCSEDCAFCSQSAFYQTSSPEYPFLPGEKLLALVLDAEKLFLDRYSIVTSGRSLNAKDLEGFALALEAFPKGKLRYCASLGILSESELYRLKEAGLTRYHHNLETAASLFPSICSTHSYEERIQTLKNAKKAGLEICCGGIFGLGETPEQILEFAKTLAELDVDAVPMNFLVPHAGTPLGSQPLTSPLLCLAILAAFRLFLPQTHLIVCGGREQNLGSLQPLAFFAGATGLMVGDFLTSEGRGMAQDLAMLRDGGWHPVFGGDG